jgi:hypothetical protein
MRGEDDDAFRARMEAKGERNRYFRSLWSVAEEAARQSPQVTVKPKKAPKEKVERAPRTPREAPRAEPCAGGCGRITRPWDTSQEQYPGTVKRVSGKKCDACFNGRRAQGELRPERCVSCDVPMTTARSPKPGAVRHSANGLCHRCYERGRLRGQRSGPRPPMVTDCKDCGEQTLHVRKLPPGSTMRRYVGSGRCSACYARWQRQGAVA